MIITYEDGIRVMTADNGYTFIRIIDGFEIGTPIYLGIDYSTGVPREDKPEYYQETLIPEPEPEII